MVAIWMAASVPCVARADDTMQREAQARFEEGIARVKAGNLEGARLSFTQAYALLEKPTILWNLALTDEKTGHLLEALDHFRQYARNASGPDDHSNADKHIAALVAQTTHLDVAAPPGAQVVVDGNAAGVAPLPEAVDVLPGPHRLEARTAQSTRTADVDGLAGQLVHVNLLPPPVLAPEPAPETHDPAPNPEPALPETPAPVESPSPATGRVTAVAVLGAAAAASAGFGVYFALQSQNNERAAEGYRQANPSSACFNPSSAAQVNMCTSWNDNVQAQGRDAILSDVLYVAGGALVVGAVATWLLWPSETRTGAVVVTPVVGTAGAGVRAMGRF
jgi:hypothetical protein